MRMNAKTIVAAGLSAVIAAGCADTGLTEFESSVAEAGPRSESAGIVWSSSIVTEFPDGDVIPGASARLGRGMNGVNAWLTTHGLATGHAYTLWVVVFNHPAECIVPNACAIGDAVADDPAVGVDLFNAAALVAGGSGKGSFSGRVEVGEEGLRGVGLLDAFEPEIHLVVRDHGPKLSGDEQLKEFGGGCDVFACANIQDALHF